MNKDSFGIKTPDQLTGRGFSCTNMAEPCSFTYHKKEKKRRTQ